MVQDSSRAVQGTLNTADHDLLLAVIWLPFCHWYTALRLPGHFYSLCLVLPHVNSGREPAKPSAALGRKPAQKPGMKARCMYCLILSHLFSCLAAQDRGDATCHCCGVCCVRCAQLVAWHATSVMLHLLQYGIRLAVEHKHPIALQAG